LKHEIDQRHQAVAWLLENHSLRQRLQTALTAISDLERIVSAIHNFPQVRHLGQIKESLIHLELIQKLLAEQANLPPRIAAEWGKPDELPHSLLHELNQTLVKDELPPLLDERRFVKAGISEMLDELFEIDQSAQRFLREYEEREKKKYDISSLKVKYNKVIGYFIEISKGLTHKAPDHYVRRQTLVGKERYTNEELKELETRILNAKDEILTLQKGIFTTLLSLVFEQVASLKTWAARVASLDVLVSFAKGAHERQYQRPQMSEDGELLLLGSRHPVVEELFKEEVFVANDVHLNCGNRHLAILTGPNMSGKSTFIRQIGLIQIMAQAGSFVPANTAKIPVCDRVFTRIGAFDRLFQGESTFYVEMSECAKIFHNFTAKSLILLDEVGRGTSTFDGISITRAMIEFLNRDEIRRPKTLFATHYAELAEMIEPDKGIIGLTVQVLEEDGKIIFLRKITEGTADKSYGIYVAELAGLPKVVIERAQHLLRELETEGLWHAQPVFQTPKPRIKKKKESEAQPSMFDST